MAEASSTPSRLDLRVYAGDENRFELEVLSDGTPVDLNGATITAQARQTPASATISISATFTELNFDAGQFVMSWDGELIRTLLAGKEEWSGAWDLQIKLTGKTLPTTVLAGKWIAEHDVTRTGA